MKAMWLGVAMVTLVLVTQAASAQTAGRMQLYEEDGAQDIGLVGKDVEAWNDASRALSNGQLDRAERLLRPLASKYKHSAVLAQLGTVLARKGNTAEGIKWLKEAVALSPRSTLALLNLGAVYLAEGRAHDARRTILRAHRIDRNDPVILSNLALSMAMVVLVNHERDLARKRPMLMSAAERDEIGRGLYALDRVHSKHPKHADAYGARAFVCAVAGDESCVLLSLSRLERLGWRREAIEEVRQRTLGLVKLQKGRNAPIRAKAFR